MLRRMVLAITLTAGALFVEHAPASDLPQREDERTPLVVVTDPINLIYVGGTVSVKARASDCNGISRLEVYIDGVLKATQTDTNSIAYVWDTTQENDGGHTIFAKAYGRANRTGLSPFITVIVDNDKSDDE